MDYRDFHVRFGGSARSKHSRKASWWSFPSWKKIDRPTVTFPAASGLPKEFIRLDPWEIEYLYLLASRAKTGILEIGRLRGGSTFLLACANETVPIWSIDISPKNDQFLQESFVAQKIGINVRLITGDSNGHYPEIGPLDFIFVDGDHSYAGCSSDIANWKSKLRSGGMMVFHDCYLGNEVQRAILDFLSAEPTWQPISSPYVVRSHWRHPTGSILAIIKP